jgi:cytochrome c oxidase subunit III
MNNIANPPQKRIHPHKFTLWVALASIIMMFAGLTSAYIVKKNLGNFLQFKLPNIFWYSTLVILISSLTIYWSQKAFKARQMQRYRQLITLTALLGLTFMAMQIAGFFYLDGHGVQLFGSGSNASASFLGVITGLHMLHVLGGVVALLVIFIQAFNTKVKLYNSNTIDIVATYWHFVDILWIYLFVFFSWVHA